MFHQESLVLPAGPFNSFAISDGTLYSWGDNARGQLGFAKKDKYVVPTKVGLDEIVLIAPGGNFTLALSKSGDVYSFGANQYGQLGQSQRRIAASCGTEGIPSNIYKVPIEQTISQIAVGYSHALALDTEGHVHSWGRGDEGQLGLSARSNTDKPTMVEIDYKVAHVACGSSSSFLISTENQLYVCGRSYMTGFVALQYLKNPVNLIVTGWYHHQAFQKNPSCFVVVDPKENTIFVDSGEMQPITLPENVKPKVHQRFEPKNEATNDETISESGDPLTRESPAYKELLEKIEQVQTDNVMLARQVSVQNNQIDKLANELSQLKSENEVLKKAQQEEYQMLSVLLGSQVQQNDLAQLKDGQKDMDSFFRERLKQLEISISTMNEQHKNDIHELRMLLNQEQRSVGKAIKTLPGTVESLAFELAYRIIVEGLGHPISPWQFPLSLLDAQWIPLQAHQALIIDERFGDVNERISSLFHAYVNEK